MNLTMEHAEVANKIGDWIARSGMFGVSTPDQGKIIAFSALANGVDPFQYMRTYHVVEGKLTMRADAMLAELEKAGGRVEWKTSTPEICEATFYGPNDQKGFTVIVSLKELKETGVAIGKDKKTKANYAHFPRQMLRARAIAEGVRAVCARAINGFYTPEEAAEFEELETTPKQTSGWTRGIPQAEPMPPAPPAKELEPAKPVEPPPPSATVTKQQLSAALAKWQTAKNCMDVIKTREKFLGGRNLKDVCPEEYPAILAAVEKELN